MRLIKMFGLAAIAAVAAMAFMGVSSAMATQSTTLCKVEIELPCAAPNQYPAKQHLEGLAEDPVLLSSAGNILCEHSIVLGFTLQALATAPNPLEVELTLVDFSKCSLGAQSCEVTTESLGKDLLVLKLKYNEALVLPHATEVRVHCGFLVDCKYTGLPDLIALGTTSTTAATIHANKAKLESLAGGFCPATAEWDALYKIILPTPIYISS